MILNKYCSTSRRRVESLDKAQLSPKVYVGEYRMGRVKIYRWITRLEDSSEESSLNPLTKDEMNLAVSDMR